MRHVITYCCDEHLDEAIEESLEDGGLPPDIEKLIGGVQGDVRCFMCLQQATHKVERPLK